MARSRIGYVRVSAADQNDARQLEGEQLDRVFRDHASAKDIQRPGLAELIRYVRDGDVVVVHSMDRLARDLDDLRRLVDGLTGRGVQVRFVKEGLTFTGEDSPVARLMLSVMGAVAEFERSLLRERQREGIALAKARGVYRGRKGKLSAEQVDRLRARAAAGEPKTVLAQAFGISRETVYTYLRAPKAEDRADHTELTAGEGSLALGGPESLE